MIFHFYDDFSKPNLRAIEMRFEGNRPVYIYLPKREVPASRQTKRPCIDRTVVTWAPASYELGLLWDLINYANFVNGLKEQAKRKLRKELIIVTPWTEDEVDSVVDRLEHFQTALGKKIHAVGFNKDKETGKSVWNWYVELCPEYIDYLKDILKPYMK